MRQTIGNCTSFYKTSSTAVVKFHEKKLQSTSRAADLYTTPDIIKIKLETLLCHRDEDGFPDFIVCGFM